MHATYDASDMVFIVIEPQKFKNAIKEDKWVKAIDEEMNVINKTNTWELVDPHKGKEVIDLKWIYKSKYNKDRSLQKHKARLVAKVILRSQESEETFAPVAWMEAIRTVLP